MLRRVSPLPADGLLSYVGMPILPFIGQCRLYSPKVKRVSTKSTVKIANRVRVDIRTANIYTLPTRLATANPLVSSEWDFERNPGHVYPKIVGCGDITPYWWRCRSCGSHFKMSTEQRVLRKGGCGCSKRLAANMDASDVLQGEADDMDDLLEGERQARKPLSMRPRPKIGD